MMNKEYKHGWHVIMEYDEFPLGLNEDIVRALSAVKDEPEWLLDFRLRAYRRWLTMEEPEWSDNRWALCVVSISCPMLRQSPLDHRGGSNGWTPRGPSMWWLLLPNASVLDLRLRAYRRWLTIEEQVVGQQVITGATKHELQQLAVIHRGSAAHKCGSCWLAAVGEA